MKAIRPIHLVLPVLLLVAGLLSDRLLGLFYSHPFPTVVIGLLALAASVAMARHYPARTTDLSPDELARDFIRFDKPRPSRDRSAWDRVLAFTPWGGHYSLSIQPVLAMPLTDIVRIYKQFADRPIYVHRDIATLDIDRILVSGPTREGIVRDVERCLKSHGVLCTSNRERTATIMIKRPNRAEARAKAQANRSRSLTPLISPCSAPSRHAH